MFLYFNFSDRNGLYAKQTSLFVIVTQHSNSHVHEALEIIFFIGYVISSVVNMTSEKYNLSEVSIFLKEEPKWNFVRLCMCYYYISLHNNREIYVQNASTS